MKLAHLSDLHLGFRQYERLTPRGANQREADVATALKRAVDDLLQQEPDCVVIAGDVFNAVRPTNAAILTLFRELDRLRKALPATKVIMVAGNHDTPRSAETGSILRLYEALGVEIVIDVPRRIMLPNLDAAVLAVPHSAVAQAEHDPMAAVVCGASGWVSARNSMPAAVIFRRGMGPCAGSGGPQLTPAGIPPPECSRPGPRRSRPGLR